MNFLACGPDASDKKIDQRIRHGNQIILFFRMQPGIDHFIDGTQNETLYQADIKIFANAALLLTQFHDFRQQVLVHLGHLSNLGFGQAAALVGFHLINHGHIPVPLEFRQMPPDEIAKFIQSIVRFFNLSPEPVKYLLGSVTEKLHQNVILIFKIKIDGAIRHTGLFRDLGDR
jgi:hypothetical protein